MCTLSWVLHICLSGDIALLGNLWCDLWTQTSWEVLAIFMKDITEHVSCWSWDSRSSDICMFFFSLRILLLLVSEECKEMYIYQWNDYHNLEKNLRTGCSYLTSFIPRFPQLMAQYQWPIAKMILWRKISHPRLTRLCLTSWRPRTWGSDPSICSTAGEWRFSCNPSGLVLVWYPWIFSMVMRI